MLDPAGGRTVSQNIQVMQGNRVCAHTNICQEEITKLSQAEVNYGIKTICGNSARNRINKPIGYSETDED